MRLSKIKLAGFKSFVDPTTIALPSNLVGIIGPNGCGKSNTIDAVRWVMGESSAKNLRGDSMADVIFNGSSARKPVGQASIELVFDNAEGSLGGQYAQYNEISIKRQVTRDGQSNYYLNGTRCRRKDITDIFLGTGLGPRSYAIIEQGTISRLIEAKPDELRVFIEEAAGISRYKERRRETENRIRHTRDNIDRINDLRDELEKRLATLQRQARAAERYKELKEEERQYKAQLQSLRWQALNGRFEERQKEIREQEVNLEARIAEIRKAEASIESKRDEQSEAVDAFNNIQGEYYSVGANIARLEQAIQHAREKRAQHQKELAETEAAWTTNQEHIAGDRSRIAELTASLGQDEQTLSEAREREQVANAELHDAEEAMHGWQQDWDAFNAQSAEQLRTAEVERARIEHLEQHEHQLSDREKRLADEKAGLVPAGLDDEIRELETRLAQLEEQLAQAAESLEDKQSRLGETREEINRLSGDLEQERQQIQVRRERFASLQALQEEALNKGSEAVSQWLGEQGLDKASRLAQQMDVAEGWDKAVEQVLGFHLESLCIDDLTNVTGQLGALQQGAVGMVDKRARVAELPAAKGTRLADKVRCDWNVAPLLGHVYVADDLGQALAMRERLDAHESVITPGGAWVGPNWLRLERSAEESLGVLGREQALKELSEDLDRRNARMAALQEQIDILKERMSDLERERDQWQTRRAEIARDQGTVQSQLSGKKARWENIQNRLQRIDSEINELKSQIQSDHQELQMTRARLDEALRATESHSQQREDLLKRRDDIRLTLEETRKQAKAQRDATHELELRCQSMRTQLNATQESLARTESQLEHLARRRDELQAYLATADEPIESMAQELEQMLAKRLEVESYLGDARRRVEEIEHSMRNVNEARAKGEQLAQELRSQLEQARMGSQELRVRAQTILEQIVESGHDVKQVLETMPEEANEQAWQENLERIDRTIQRLGAINLAAIDEYQTENERKQYLDAQFEDLNEALNTLENAIAKIDKETKQRFRDTFDKVNAGLQRMFPRLFGGGAAYLELTGEDLLDTGVTVMARPPGKRNSTIHLLSGGEKALTAVAMVFSIFELNPAPFCMLDEVDAPLDDANVGRFCELVREMSERVQFIFITHNKVTMELANQLMGVTMNEPGVSRLVAVDVDEAVVLAEAS